MPRRWKAKSGPPTPSRTAISTTAWFRFVARTVASRSTARSIRARRPRSKGSQALKPAFTAVADYPLDDQGTTYRNLILQKYPDLNIDFMHHAGNSSGVVDGSAAVLLASPSYARAHGLKPRARVVAMANMGDCPTLMLNARCRRHARCWRRPVSRWMTSTCSRSTRPLRWWPRNSSGISISTATRLTSMAASIALGHPIGATGSILIGTILDELERRDLKRGLVTMCAAGGMAPAIIIERV